MRRIIFTLAGCLVFLNAFSQHQLSLSASVDATDAIRFTSLDGASSSAAGTGYSLSMLYMFPLNKQWNLQTGLTYRQVRHTVIANLPPDETIPDRDIKRNLISLPIVFRRYFGVHATRLYMDLGSSLDFENEVAEDLDNNTGLSLIFSPGIEQKLGNILSLNLAPQFQMYSLIPFQKEAYHRHLIAAGVEVSILYSLY